MNGIVASQQGNAYASGNADSVAIDANRHAETHTSEVLATDGAGIAAGEAYSVASADNNANVAYSQSASAAAGNGYSNEQTNAIASH